MQCDYLIVGAGLFGAVMAERLANDKKAKIIVIDKRSHIGGNCYSKYDEETDIEYHLYGTHIFHTSSEKVWNYITQFTEFNGYYHQVLTTYKNKVYQMPINLKTINSFYNLNLKPYEVDKFLKKEASKSNITKPKNFEEKAISLIGKPLYEAFIKGYTTKQWGKSPTELPAGILKRLPVRSSYKDDYFHDARWQGIPVDGYTAIFEKMFKSSNIEVHLNCNYFDHKNKFDVNEKIIYTGPIDRYFNYQLGHLEWRSIELEQKVVNVEDFQGTSVMNFAEESVEYTRIHEPRHLHPERTYTKDKTIIFYERSKEDPNNPYYPINTETNRTLYKKYRELADNEKDLIIGGRLGNYAYYDMDKTILAALNCYRKLLNLKNVQ